MLTDVLLASSAYCFVAASGAGAGLQKTLWDTPGASNYLAGGHFPYAPELMENFVGFKPEKFVSRQNALDMAISSYVQAARCNKPGKFPVGLGITAAATTTRELRGGTRVHIAAISKHGVRGISAELDSKDRASDGQDVDYLGGAVLQAAVEGSSLYNSISEDELRQALFARPYFTRTGERLKIPQGALTIFPGAFNPVHDGHLINSTSNTIFQITASAPHKDPISVHDLLQRVAWIKNKNREVLLLDKQGNTYLEKARMFPDSRFLLGPDALQRMLDPKWGHEPLSLLREMCNLNIDFVMSPRTGMPTLAELLANVPDEFHHMFSAGQETEFSGLSSSQIRAKTV